MGCESDPTTTTALPPVTICSYANNTLGTCEVGHKCICKEVINVGNNFLISFFSAENSSLLMKIAQRLVEIDTVFFYTKIKPI